MRTFYYIIEKKREKEKISGHGYIKEIINTLGEDIAYLLKSLEKESTKIDISIKTDNTIIRIYG